MGERIKVVIDRDGDDEIYYLEVHSNKGLSGDDQVELIDQLESKIRTFYESKSINVTDCHTGQ